MVKNTHCSFEHPAHNCAPVIGVWEILTCAVVQINVSQWILSLCNVFFYWDISQLISNKNSVKTLSHTAPAPKAPGGTIFIFPGPTLVGVRIHKGAERKGILNLRVETEKKNLLWCIFWCSPKISVKSVFA